MGKIKNPQWLFKYLNKYIIGQEKAKKQLSVIIYNHYKKYILKSIKINKSNVLLIGPIGSGKTYMLKILAKILNLPLIIIDATSLTQVGYSDENVKDIIYKLLKISNFNNYKAKYGIVYIDKIDKIIKTENLTEKKNRDGEIQQALFKIIEGIRLNFFISYNNNNNSNNDNNDNNEIIEINTKDILFIYGGTFSRIKNIQNKIFGFIQEKEINNIGKINILKKRKKKKFINILYEDIIKYDFILEFIPGMSVIIQLNSLTIFDLKQVMFKPKNSLLKQYKLLFNFELVNLNLIIKNCAINAIVKCSYFLNIGAKSLKLIIEKLLNNIMFIYPKYRFILKIIFYNKVIRLNFEPIMIY